jgi:hypothetical protein
MPSSNKEALMTPWVSSRSSKSRDFVRSKIIQGETPMRFQRLFVTLGMFFMLIGAVGFPHTASAQTVTAGGVTCTALTATTFPSGNGAYPADGHMWECVPNVPFGDENSIFSIVSTGLKSAYGGQIGAGGEIMNHGVIYYHFATQANAISFMNATYPGSNTLPTTSNSKCGYTGYDVGVMGIGQRIITSIFESCHYTKPTTQDVPNTGLQETTAHESGHAFDFALALDSSAPPQPTSATVAYKALVNADLTLLNNVTKFPTCTLFGTAASSLLEYNLGADAQTPVCTGNTVNTAYATKSNLQILQLKAPYFFFPATSAQFREAWAQQFAYVTGHSGTSGFMPVSDSVIKLMNGNGGCSDWTVRWWKDWLIIPAAGGEYPNYCTIYPASNWNR